MKILICGSRKTNLPRNYILQKILEILRNIGFSREDITLIEGCCPNSADSIAEYVSKEYDFKIIHFPSSAGNYLKRNVDMIENADTVVAFWDGYSYGTAFTIATAVKKGIPVKIFDINNQEI